MAVLTSLRAMRPRLRHVKSCVANSPTRCVLGIFVDFMGSTMSNEVLHCAEPPTWDTALV